MGFIKLSRAQLANVAILLVLKSFQQLTFLASELRSAMLIGFTDIEKWLIRLRDHRFAAADSGYTPPIKAELSITDVFPSIQHSASSSPEDLRAVATMALGSYV